MDLSINTSSTLSSVIYFVLVYSHYLTDYHIQRRIKDESDDIAIFVFDKFTPKTRYFTWCTEKKSLSKRENDNTSSSIPLCLLRSKEREEHVERNLDSVDIWNAPLVTYELEVDQVYNWPHLPRSLTGRE